MVFPLIEDYRSATDFSSRTFSLCNKLETEKDLFVSLLRGDIETSVYRSADLLCAGHGNAAWDVFIDFFCKHIGTINCNVVVFLSRKLEKFSDLFTSLHNPLEIRNMPIARRAFGEICAVLCLSTKRPAVPQGTTIRGVAEFRLDNLSYRVKATSETFIYSVIDADDSPEIHIPINELGYNIHSGSLNILEASYWIEWIIEYDHLCRQNKDRCTCSERKDLLSQITAVSYVNNANRVNIIWVVWQLFLIECEQRPMAAFYNTIAIAAMRLFGYKFTSAIPRKRRGLLLFMIYLLCEPLPSGRRDTVAPSQMPIVNSTIENLDTIYETLQKDQQQFAKEDAMLYDVV